MRGFDIKQIHMRSFQISGLTAKWGIGGGRSPIWDNNLVGYWDARDLPNGELNALANKATMAGKAPDLTVTGATMANGTLQFDGVDDVALTKAFTFPDRFTVFWDIDWLGSESKYAGIVHRSDLFLYNHVEKGDLLCYIKNTSDLGVIPNTSVGLSTNGNIYARDGGSTPFGAAIGTGVSPASVLTIAKNGTVFTQMGFRQLLIFNKELSQAEVNDVLRVMSPTIWDNNLIGRWDARAFPDGKLATIPNTATMAGKAPDLTVTGATGATMASGTLQFDGVDDYAATEKFSFPERYTVFWDIDWLGSGDKSAGIVHPYDLFLFNSAASGKLECYIKNSSGSAYISNTNVGLSTNGNIYVSDGSVTPFGGVIGTDVSPAQALTIAKMGNTFTQMGFRQLLIFNKELSQDEVDDVLRVMFPA